MCDAFDGPGRCDFDLSGEIDVPNLVGRGLRRGVGGAPILLQQLGRRGRGRAEIIVGDAHVDMKFGLIVLDADVAIEAPNVRCLEISKSAVVQPFERAVDGEIVDLLAPLRRALDPPERAAHGIDLGAVIAEAILHLDVDGPAEGVQPECGIVGHHGDRFDGGGRNQIPVDGVAERFVDTHAVLVHGEPLRRAGHRRSDEAAELHIGREWIAVDFVEGDARYVFHQRIGDVERAGLLDLTGVDGVDARRYLVGIHASAGQRRGRIDEDSLQGPNRAARSAVAAGFDALFGPGHFDRRQLLNVAGSLRACAFSPGSHAYRYRRDTNDRQRSSAHSVPSRSVPACSGVRRPGCG